MEEFKKRLLHRQQLILAGMLFACFVFILSSRFGKAETAPEFMRGFIDGFQVGVAACFLGVMIIFAVKYFIAISRPDRLKKLYIFETDERRIFIKQKTGNLGMNVIIYGLAVGTSVAGNLNNTVFFSLLGACLFVTSVRGIMKLYYNRKY